MAIPLKLGNTTKRINSTFQPDSTTWTNYNVNLKMDTSLEAPVFIIQANVADLAGYNYAVGAGILKGFYWIRDVVSVAAGRCEVYCVRDVLANNKAEILATSAFIEYGFNAFDAGDAAHRVADTRQPISSTPSMLHNTADITGGIISTTGIYVLQVISQNNGVVSYVLNRGTLDRLLQNINTSLYDDISDIIRDPTLQPMEKLVDLTGISLSQELSQDIALQSIQSCIWLPINRAPIAQSRIYLGNWDTGLTAARLTSDSVYSYETTIAIPWTHADWRRKNSQIVLYLPFMGTVPIPVDQCVSVGSLNITWSLEYFSGNIAVTVKAGHYTVYTGSANIAASVAIGRSAVNTGNIVGGAIQAIGGGLQAIGGAIDLAAGALSMAEATATLGVLDAGRTMSGGATAVASGYGAMWSGGVSMIQPTITCAGSMSGLAGAGQPLLADLCLIYYAPLDDAGFSAKYGHPVMRIANPVAGFCKTRGFSLASPDRMGDVSTVNAAMDGGVFIE